MEHYSNLILMFVVLLLAVVAVMLYGLVRISLKLRSAAAEREESSPVGFVVDTFHGLVAQLKDKERELDDLRKAAETRADITEEYNENILQSVHSGVVSMDGQWKIVKANAAAVQILGMEEGSLSGHDGREALAPIIPETSSGGLPPQRVQRGECEYTTAKGRLLWLGFSLTPLKDKAGEEIGHILVFTDLTELRALEAQSALRQRLSSLGEMAAGIAHELRNSMGAISGYMRLLEKKTSPEAAETIKKVSAEVGVMNRIVGDFLSFARPGEPRLEILDLAGIASECSVAYAPESGVEVEFAAPEGKVLVSGDEVLLRQALANLIQNAVQALPEAGRVFVDLQVLDDSAVLRVTDKGHGIDPAMLERIFDPFFTTRHTGTGLGLAIVHRSITSFGGAVDVESSPEGTTFSITLPLA